MKKLFFFLFFLPLIILSSCSKELKVNNGPSNNNGNDVGHFLTSESFAVPVKAGFVSIVKLGDDTIAVATKPMNIMIPKGKEQTKAQFASNIGVEYVPTDEYQNKVGTLNVNWYEFNQLVCFEDTIDGDYDYNDFVFRAKYGFSMDAYGFYFGFCIQPIALGSSKYFDLGCIVYYNDGPIYDDILTSNGCRKEFFNGQTGFINTSLSRQINQTINGKVASLHEFDEHTSLRWGMSMFDTLQPIRVEWYIKLQDGTKLFALSTKYVDQSFDKDHLPYGLVISETGKYLGSSSPTFAFDYPVESVSIREVYPELWNWLNGKRAYNPEEIFTKSSTTESKTFPAYELGMYGIDSEKEFHPALSGDLVNYRFHKDGF
jgi:hypothetical protein